MYELLKNAMLHQVEHFQSKGLNQELPPIQIVMISYLYFRELLKILPPILQRNQ